MANYLPIIVIAVIIFIALMWWLSMRGSVKSNAPTSTDVVPPKAVPAPPVAKLMDDPKPTSKTAPPKAQAPLKSAPTKPAPAKAPAKPPVKKAVAPKVVAPKAVTPKTTAAKAAPKTAAPKAATASSPKVAAPKAKAAPKAAPKMATPDNLELLKGVGPKVNALLTSMGITSFDQIANWSPADITEIDSKLGAFAGRIGRDNWVDQAKLLAAGDVTGFQKKYGALGSEIAKG